MSNMRMYLVGSDRAKVGSRADGDSPGPMLLKVAATAVKMVSSDWPLSKKATARTEVENNGIDAHVHNKQT